MDYKNKGPPKRSIIKRLLHPQEFYIIGGTHQRTVEQSERFLRNCSHCGKLVSCLLDGSKILMYSILYAGLF